MSIFSFTLHLQSTYSTIIIINGIIVYFFHSSTSLSSTYSQKWLENSSSSSRYDPHIYRKRPIIQHDACSRFFIIIILSIHQPCQPQQQHQKERKKLKKQEMKERRQKTFRALFLDFFLSLLNPYIQLYMMLRVNEWVRETCWF